MIRVLVCDDQAVVAEGLEMILNADTEIEVVGLAYGGAEAIDKADQSQPDVILMDLKMPGVNGIQATREIHKVHPDIKILVLTTFGDDEWVFDAVRSGAAGYLLKGTPRDELIKAVKGTAAGEAFIDPAVGSKILAQVARSASPQETTVANDLSEREMDVLRLLAQGFLNAEIAEKLYLTKGTVRNYVSSILTKLEVEDRTQAAILAIRHGLVESR
ncbi:MAG: response regulator transcription factor [Anaerolineales bacterium]|nr:response regulator transcription factor [Chloroflexota bacterium]MBL6982613.1 response regulator transcription factor [Anaerolineales bacterium]